MACRPCLECLLKFLNLLMIIVGLAMIGYGIYLFVEYKSASGDELLAPSSGDFVLLGRPMLMTVSLSANIFDKLPKAWFLYLFIGVGVVLFVFSCFGCIATVTRNGCCLSCYSVLIVLLILIELGCAAFIFFDKSWKQDLPTDKTGYFDKIFDFLKENWSIVKWVALGIVVFEMAFSLIILLMHNIISEVVENRLERNWFMLVTMNRGALVFLLTLMVRAANRPAEYDSDDELIAPRQQIRQPLINRPVAAATGVPVSGALDQRPGRNDAWSTRMREKYGLDTSEFTYNPSESHRFQQVPTQPTEERSRCIIM